ncbi:Serine/threonine protein phosphatase PP1 isozyme7/Phosphoesterase/ calcineurin type [Giardia duodenalis assemblage B]|uniref:Serine/threonine-protein phosphatase n=1 Tax=Giardia duodenalis assemblage B TaxID=1394984 RepID=A0A132NP58_GIAIN|nr:Serine/threonine protein phosphatase PP1 isozyme7/Phosphoesterase/ calcineurin type [Giardia intestinalis assemblage B]
MEMDVIDKAYENLTQVREPGMAVDLDVADIRTIVEKGCAVLNSQPNVLYIKSNIYIVGDTHGQLHDILNYFNVLGSPLTKNYLFLGDVVDRGYQSVECLLLMLVCKIKRPNNFFIIRGNHETTDLQPNGRGASLKEECDERYSEEPDLVFNLLMRAMDSLPLVAIIGRRILCVHGCLASNFSLEKLKEQKLPFSLNSLSEEMRDIVTNLLWSDPFEYTDSKDSFPVKHVTRIGDSTITAYENPKRGSGEKTPDELSCNILDKYGFDILVRGHECFHDGMSTSVSGRVFTVFGATHYHKNVKDITASAVMQVSKDMKISFVQFFEETRNC